MTTAASLFRVLQSLAPEAPLLVGRVIAIHEEDDTSSVLLPSALGTESLGANLAAGSIIRPRGTWVPVGENAFVRRGLIESRAPAADPVQVIVGTIEPIPETAVDPPLDTHVFFTQDGTLLGTVAEETRNGASWTDVADALARADGMLVFDVADPVPGGGVRTLGPGVLSLQAHRISPTGWQLRVALPQYTGQGSVTVRVLLARRDEPDTIDYIVETEVFFEAIDRGIALRASNAIFDEEAGWVASGTPFIAVSTAESLADTFAAGGIDIDFAPEGMSHRYTGGLPLNWSDGLGGPSVGTIEGENAALLAGRIVREVTVGAAIVNLTQFGEGGELPPQYVPLLVDSIELTEILGG